MLNKTKTWRTTLVAAAVVSLLGACSKQAEQSQAGEPSAAEAAVKTEATNPFFSTYQTPFEIPPFAEISNDDFMPAFEKGMAEHLADIDDIVNNSDSNIRKYDRSIGTQWSTSRQSTSCILQYDRCEH